MQTEYDVDIDAPAIDLEGGSLDSVVAGRVKRQAAEETDGDSEADEATGADDVDAEEEHDDEEDGAEDGDTPDETPEDGEETEPKEEADAEEPDEGPTEAPQFWTAEDKALWDKVPADVRKVILRREQEVVAYGNRLAEQSAAQVREATQERAQKLEAAIADAELLINDRYANVSDELVDQMVAAGKITESDAYRFRRDRDREQAKLEQLRSARDAAAQRDRETFVREESAKLRQLVPDFFDASKGQGVQAQIAKHAAEIGVTAEEYASLDARSIATLYEASEYRRLKAEAEKAGKAPKAKPAPKRAAKPQAAGGVSKPAALKALEKKMRTPGGLSVEEAARMRQLRAGLS